MKKLLIVSCLLSSLWSTVDAFATVRYWSSGGSDSNTCVQSQSSATPKLTLASAKTCMVPGDTLKILAGSTFTGSQPMDLRDLTGTAANPYRIEVDSGTVTFNVTATATACRWIVTNSTTQWITISGLNGSLIFDGSSCPDNYIGNSVAGVSNVTFQGIEVRAFKVTGFYVTGSTNVILEKSYIHDQVSPTCVSGTRYYGVYLHDGTNIIIRNNRISGNPGGGMQIYPGPLSGVTVTKNEITGNNSCPASPIGGMVIAASSAGGALSGIVVSRNIIYGNGAVSGGGGIRLYATTNTQTGTKIYNNTIYGNLAGSGDGYGIKVEAGPSGTLITNNHIVGNASGAISDAGTGTISTSNRTTGTVTDCTPSTSVFTQKSGSVCIDAGIDVGLPYNGSAPDIGAFETFVFASCQVPNGAANTIQVSFTSNADLLGSTLTTFTARKSAVSNALTGAATKIGDTIVSLPLTNTYTGGDTADISWSSGGLTDNALIGRNLNQPFVQTLTNQSCTNNVSAPPGYLLTQARFQYRGVYGPETTLDIRGAENQNPFYVIKNGAVRIRFAVTDSTANAPSFGLLPRYSRNGGGYTVVPSSFNADGIQMCESRYPSIGVTSGAATTNQLTTGGTFIPGAVLLTASAIPNIVGLNIGYKTEVEYCFTWNSTASGVFVFRLYEQSGAPLGAYTSGAEPTVTLTAPTVSIGP